VTDLYNKNYKTLEKEIEEGLVVENLPGMCKALSSKCDKKLKQTLEDGKTFHVHGLVQLKL
jgi:hypothetical protein